MTNKGKKIAVLGGGASGIAAARLALAGGALVSVFDSAEASSLASARSDLEKLGIELHCGTRAMEVPADIDLIVISPGIDRAVPLAQAFLKTGAPMVGEIEFAFQRDERSVVAITGTNGKTTSTGLLTHLLNAAGQRAVAAGNYGKPYSEVVMEPDRWDVVVLELSSFQLEEIDTFRPDVAVWLNFAPDHMDRYRTLDDYRRAKMRIFENQRAEDVAIVNAMEVPQGIRAKQVCFSAFDGKADYTYEAGGVYYHDQWLVDIGSTKLHGRHNVENVMAAMAAARALDVPFEVMGEPLGQYGPPPHRYEKVGDFNGVTYINDSKATNLHALASSLRGQGRKILLIAGGKDKGLDYSGISSLVADKVDGVVAIGEMANAIVSAWRSRVPCRKAASLEEAVNFAGQMASKGQLVLFSPGTSSFDMFNSYVERGERFKEIVSQIKTQAGV